MLSVCVNGLPKGHLNGSNKGHTCNGRQNNGFANGHTKAQTDSYIHNHHGDDQQYGLRHLPVLIDQRARDTPNRTLISLAKTADVRDGFDDISYNRFAQAVDRCSYWLEEQVGRCKDYSKPNAIFACLSRHDPRSAFLNIAAPKAGYQMYWSVPGSEPEDVVSGVNGIECRIALMTDPCPTLAPEILKQCPMKTLHLPHMNSWLSDKIDPQLTPYPYEHDISYALEWPCNIFQTSGTTAPPKPIIVRHGSILVNDRFHTLPEAGADPTIYQRMTGKRVLSTFGWAQYAGFLFSLGNAVLYDYVAVLMGEIGDWTSDHLRIAQIYGNIQVTLLYPAICVLLAQDEAALQSTKALDFVGYAGSSVPLWAGRKIAEYTNFETVFGSSEAGLFPMDRARSQQEYPYMRLHRELGHEFRPYLDQYHHMVIVRRPEFEQWQVVFANFTDLEEWPTGDLFESHPTDLGLWRAAGRIADLLTFAEGRQINAVAIEEQLMEIGGIQLAMVCGQSGGSFVVLLTPEEGVPQENMEEFVSRRWPTIQYCFETRGPAWARGMLRKDFVRVTPPGRPILRTGGKWNVNRKKTLMLHQASLEADIGPLQTGLFLAKK
ncbi:MAG: hypothetical protein M1828_002378 [Chrysothrix sp. TS-e1954]|nr:MAG: hypothetical protein M1828_002378 [Chrysothrix sp. TS-e1954]